MPFSHRRGRGKAQKEHFLLLSMLFIFSLGAIGIGFAAWEDTLNLDSTLTTGYIEPVFIEAWFSENGAGQGQGNENGYGPGKGTGLVNVADEGKSLTVELDDAQHGDVYFLNFTIKNNGSLPVEIEATTVTAGQALEVDMLHKPEKILEGQAQTEGGMKIRVNAPHLTEDYGGSFIVVLDYRQAGLL